MKKRVHMADVHAAAQLLRAATRAPIASIAL
jgi:hypothetical protein